jgi:hypothetical protein
MAATYSASSPWHDTTQNRLYLEIWRPRPVPSSQDDFSYKGSNIRFSYWRNYSIT